MLRGRWIPCLLLLAACGRPALVPATSARPAPVREDWPWTGRENFTHTLVLIVEERSGRIRQAFPVVVGVPPCGKPARADSSFVRQAEQFLTGVGYDFVYPGQQTPSAFGTEFVRVTSYAGDFMADVIYHRDGGMVFAGTRVWSGTGGRYYPSAAIDPWMLRDSTAVARPPASIVELEPLPPDVMPRVRRLTVVHSLAQQPYYVTAFSHNKEMQPSANDVDWVLLLVRRGTCYK